MPFTGYVNFGLMISIVINDISVSFCYSLDCFGSGSST